MTDASVGKGRGFGNKMSIQTKDVVRCGKIAGKVFNVAQNDDDVRLRGGLSKEKAWLIFKIWAFSSVDDIADLYLRLIMAFITEKDIPYGRKQGFYFAAAGSVRWRDVYQGVATALETQGHIPDDTLVIPTLDEKLDLLRILRGDGESKAAMVAGLDPRLVDYEMAGR